MVCIGIIKIRGGFHFHSYFIEHSIVFGGSWPLPTNYYTQGFMILYVILCSALFIFHNLQIKIRSSMLPCTWYGVKRVPRIWFNQIVIFQTLNNDNSGKLPFTNFNDSIVHVNLLDDLRFRLFYIGLNFVARNA